MNTNSLLALSLGLQNPDVDLTKTKPSLKQLARIIQTDVEDWEEIEDQLAVILKGNTVLNKEYQIIKARLDTMGDNIPSDLLPTLAELKQVTSLPNAETRGYHPGKLSANHELENNEVINMSVIVFASEQPKEVSKTLWKKLMDWLKQK
ncbi:hypothetical protein [Candidatus Parabeggiatoa sp. HSG14]|uniref:hypothetical protein n=1 Tax=Candidatus Parabeggiatoa sp. HSG14 TaxID=3055593 RepID=UPI0025A78F34|nr:hypothetical protein [Thiotrichales bacterium HSG14]